MVRNYKRVTDRQSWSEESMQNAMDALVKGEMGFLKASQTFKIPKATLFRRFREKNKVRNLVDKGFGNYQTVFSKTQEEELVKYVLDMESRFYGITLLDLRSIAYQLAEKNDLKHPFDNEKKLAGEDWAYGFRKRHSEISLRKPESTSIARAQAFNRYNVSKFFELFIKMKTESKVRPSRMYNCDETGLGTVPKSNNKILAHKGRKQVGRITSADRSKTTTAVIAMSSSGNFVPPMIIFARKRMKLELQDGAPPDTLFACNESGWMTVELFTRWFQHFISHTKPTENDPILLILDGHASHTKNIAVIDMARANHVHILCLPPHTTHRMQPMDVSFMGPLERYYDTALEKWLNNHPGRIVTVFQISSIFCEAYLKAASPLIAVNGFKKCGLVPYNPDVFSDVDFAPSLTTEKDVEEKNGGKRHEADNINPDEPSLPTADTLILHASSSSFCNDKIVPSSSSLLSTPRKPTSFEETSLSSLNTFTVSPQDIRPLPKSVNVTATMKKRKPGTSEILTGSPYKKRLEEELRKKEGTGNEKKQKKQKPKSKSKVKRTGKIEMNIKKRSQKKLFFSDSSDDEDAECLYCNDLFSKSASEEGWISCCSCSKWAHEACAGFDEATQDIFICEICSN